MGIEAGKVIADGIVVTLGTTALGIESDGEDPSSWEPNPFSSFSRSSSGTETGG